MLTCLCVAGIVCAAFAEKINLNIYASRFDSIPIGVVDFKAKTGVLKDDQPWKIIARDFDLCGRFVVNTSPKIDSVTGAGLYIDGEYSLDEGTVSFVCNVNDGNRRERLLTREYRGNPSQLRRLSHRFSNELYELLFGDQGMFESRILFVKAGNGTKNIGIMDFDGAGRRQITSGTVFNLFPAFVDSSTMVWTSYQRGKPDLFKGSIRDGSGRIMVASRGIQVSPAVNPVDGRIVYASSKAGSLDIYICDADGSTTKKLTSGSGAKTAPCWSPNGYQIAYTSDKSGKPQLYVMDAEGGNQKRISYKSAYCDSPVWSAKGDRIAFTSMAENGKLEIWIVSPDGTNESRLTNMPGNCEYPAWSPDGGLVAFICRQGAASDLYLVKPDGSHVRRLTQTGDVMMPDWGK
jgi:TolB protein